jgi:hypothetical protein
MLITLLIVDPIVRFIGPEIPEEISEGETDTPRFEKCQARWGVCRASEPCYADVHAATLTRLTNGFSMKSEN